jgi:hypothetical protein
VSRLDCKKPISRRMSKDWAWVEGNWRDFVARGELEELGEIRLDEICAPWSRNVHLIPSYDRLFWDIWENGIKTPLLVRPYDWPPYGTRGVLGCNESGNRIDNQPAPPYDQFSEPQYELIIGNMRFCGAYILGLFTLPCLQIPEDEWYEDVDDLWKKYHPVFEGNYYKHPDYEGIPSKAKVFSKWE